MRIKLLTICLFLFTSQVFAADNNAIYKVEIKNGKYEGEFVEYGNENYLEGEIVIKTSFQNGMIEGDYIKYYPYCRDGNCTPKIHQKYKIKNGLYEHYKEYWIEGYSSRNNTILTSFSCVDGKLHGIYKGEQFSGRHYYHFECTNGICSGNYTNINDGIVTKVRQKKFYDVCVPQDYKLNNPDTYAIKH